MKKLFGVLTIALLFSLTGMQDVTAGNWTVKVTWTDYCDGCTSIGDYEYVVCLRIRNTCTATEIYSHCVILPSNTSPFQYDFDCENVCTPDSEECHVAIATVVKRCVISQEEICSDSDGITCSCDEIYEGYISLSPELE